MTTFIFESKYGNISSIDIESYIVKQLVNTKNQPISLDWMVKEFDHIDYEMLYDHLDNVGLYEITLDDEYNHVVTLKYDYFNAYMNIQILVNK